ncbi:hypothetical protein Poli38472_010433 [Pythium oligandrum]|uniref:PNPLA domain-containing protein n=1 Tax=Pythium oligandrum TaxID=41045 RepID=A0A8K1C311_PYTOL|nr:hypothetical protein Poli38472_010433 [Pythium oligandrum]|eukprot:TMW55551.1 hypothetical protein Poli38472_010433 [Pythium oligandrum]
MNANALFMPIPYAFARLLKRDKEKNRRRLEKDTSADNSAPEIPLEKLSISFSGGGWLMLYMYGVAKAMREQGIHHRARFIGTSAGALAAIGLTLDADFDAICETVISSYVPQAHNTLKGPFQMRDYLIDALTKHANLQNFERCNQNPDKCTVVYTSLSAWKSRRRNTFKSRDHLLATLIASCCATPVVGLPFKLDGEWVMDGGVFDNQPLFEDGARTITVSPNVFSGADIRPSRYIPPWWSMYPPSQQDLRWVFDLGYEDGLSWGVRQGYADARSIRIPQKASTYVGAWKTVVGQIVGYRWIEDQVLRLVSFFTSTKTTTARHLLKFELSFWKFIAICAASVDRVTMLWSGIVSATLVGLLAEGNQHVIECAIVGGIHLAVWFSKLHNALQHVNASPQWQRLESSIVEIENSSVLIEETEEEDEMKRVKTYEKMLQKEHHEALIEASYIYRMSVKTA